jgi:hypothetical protein
MTILRTIIVLAAVVEAAAAYFCTVAVFHQYGTLASIVLAWPLACLAGLGLAWFWE